MIACEDTRRTRKLLSHAGIAADGRLRAVHAHNEAQEAADRRRGPRGPHGGLRDRRRHARRQRSRRGSCARAGPRAPGGGRPGAERGARRAGALGVLGRPVRVRGLPAPQGQAAGRATRGIAAEPRTVVLFEAPGRVAATLDDLEAVCGAERLVCVAREITKLHEEVLHGPLETAVRLAHAGEPRGEHVIVVDGLPLVAAPVTDEAVEEAVRDALDRGLSARDTAAEVASALGVPKRAPTSWRSRSGSGELLDARLAHELVRELAQLDPRRSPGRTRSAARPSRARCGRRRRPRSR